MTDEERRYEEISVQFVMIFPVQASCVLFDCTELFLFRRSSSVMKNGSEEPFFMPPSPRGKVFFQAFRHTNNNLAAQPRSRGPKDVGSPPVSETHWGEAPCASNYNLYAYITAVLPDLQGFGGLRFP